MTKERNKSYSQIPCSGRDAEVVAWKPTACVEAADGHPPAPALRKRGGEGIKQSFLGCPTSVQGHPDLHLVGGPYSLPLTEKREDSVQ